MAVIFYEVIRPTYENNTMKNFYLIIILSVISFSSFSQNMTITTLDSIFNVVNDKVIREGSKWSFQINEIPLMVIADSTHNRMRIISPITEISKLNEELKTASLMANFHTALDVKYAIANDVLWSAYIHPLKQLSKEQVVDAISQVYYGNINFGTTFSSSSLVFPGGKQKEKPKEDIKQQLLQRI